MELSIPFEHALKQTPVREAPLLEQLDKTRQFGEGGFGTPSDKYFLPVMHKLHIISKALELNLDDVFTPNPTLDTLRELQTHSQKIAEAKNKLKDAFAYYIEKKSDLLHSAHAGCIQNSFALLGMLLEDRQSLVTDYKILCERNDIDVPRNLTLDANIL